MSVQAKLLLMRRKELLFIVLISFCSVFSYATNIKGRVEIDESWEPLIYLSVINSFDDLNLNNLNERVYETLKMLGFEV